MKDLSSNFKHFDIDLEELNRTPKAPEDMSRMKFNIEDFDENEF